MLNMICFSWSVSVAVWQGHVRGSVRDVCAHVCIRICVRLKLQCHSLSLYRETWTKMYVGRFWERRSNADESSLDCVQKCLRVKPNSPHPVWEALYPNFKSVSVVCNLSPCPSFSGYFIRGKNWIIFFYGVGFFFLSLQVLFMCFMWNNS